MVNIGWCFSLFRTGVIGVLLAHLGGGCISSPSYHIGVLVGSYKARPFPLVRYWAEYSQKEFTENIINAPIMGVPAIVPIGYLGDLITDVACFPIDLPLSWFSSEPKVNVRPYKDGKYTVEISDIRNVELHWDFSRCEGLVPIDIHIEQGELLVRLVDEHSHVTELHVGAKETRYVKYDIDGRQYAGQITASNGLWRLICYPPIAGLPPFFPVAMINKEFSYPSAEVRLQPDGEKDKLGWRTFIPWGVSYGIRFIPSKDFVGEVNYQGKSIHNVIFDAPQWHFF